MTKDKKQYNIGVTMSGGGVRGFAHIGALKALSEAGIEPDIMSGTSAGAIAGALYADGHKPDDIIKMFNETKLFKYVEFIIPKRGLLKMTGLSRVIQQNLVAKTFEELPIPLYIAATNLSNGKCEYFSEGELFRRVMASSTIPVLFPPLLMNGKTYVDGGVINNFPTEPIEDKCNFMIGIHVNPLVPVDEFTSLMGIAERSFHLSFSGQLAAKEKKCDIFIEPKGIGNYKLMEVSKIKEIYNLGYKETKRILKENKELLDANT